ncbi:MAG: hypothetical protein ABSD57_10435 [Verrucomicrobiota bacterium]
MPQPKRQNATPPARLRPQWPVILVTVLIGVMAIWLALPQVFPGSEQQANEITLPNLNRRASELEQITNLVQRDSYCVPLSAYGRALDLALPPDARVFFSGMVGETNGPKLGYYYFLRNYLFPREVAVSLGDKAIFHEGWFAGTPCDSPAELETNGFDLLVRYGANGFALVPLTQNGVPK